MITTYKQILALQQMWEAISKLDLSEQDYLPVAKLSKTIKKLKPNLEDFQEMVEDLRLDNCYKEGVKIVRVDGQLQWTAEGEKSFRKEYKALLAGEVNVDVQPMNYKELFSILPLNAQAGGSWEDVEEILTPFFVNA